jgi:hypothetical protein
MLQKKKKRRGTWSLCLLALVLFGNNEKKGLNESNLLLLTIT